MYEKMDYNIPKHFSFLQYTSAIMIKNENEEFKMSFYWKARTLISGDYRELEKNFREYNNKRKFKKYYGKQDLYCSIKLRNDEGGLFCHFLKVVGALSYCAKNNLIPVVDMQTEENIFLSKQERKTVNAWELFFEQPLNISFSDIKNLDNKIILYNPSGPRLGLNTTDTNPNAQEYYRKLVHNYIRPSADVKKILNYHSHNFFTGEKTLGILARGTDYKVNLAVSHPIQPSAEQIIEKAHEYIKHFGCKKIFLATEDQKIFNKIVAEFGDLVYTIDQKRFDEEITEKLGRRKDYSSYAIKMNQAYLASIYMLSQCNCFIGGLTGGSLGAFLLGNGFESQHIFNFGCYNLDDEITCDHKQLENYEQFLKNIKS